MQSTKAQYKINQDYFELGARKVKLYYIPGNMKQENEQYLQDTSPTCPPPSPLPCVAGSYCPGGIQPCPPLTQWTWPSPAGWAPRQEPGKVPPGFDSSAFPLQHTLPHTVHKDPSAGQTEKQNRREVMRWIRQKILHLTSKNFIFTCIFTVILLGE